jgi:hypothetical protein
MTLPDGSTSFNALAVTPCGPARQRHAFRRWARGRGGEFPFEILPDGFRWSMSFGDVEIRHPATLKGDERVEIGGRLPPGRPPVRLDELRLRRVADSGWPAERAVP